MKFKNKLIKISLVLVTFILFIGCESERDVVEKNVNTAADIVSAVTMSSSIIDFSKISPAASVTEKVTIATIGKWNTPDDFPDSPGVLYSEYKIAGEDFARYPRKEDGLLEDFYDIQGYRAYVDVRRSTDGWGDFKVTLRVYPTLSTAVHYTEEIYRLKNDDWTCLINKKTDDCDSTAFESIITKYFNGNVESRKVTWNTYAGGGASVYDSNDFFGMPEKILTDNAYNWVDMNAIDTNGLSKRPQDEFSSIKGEQEFSSDVTVTMANNIGSADIVKTTSAREFYTKLLNNDGNFEDFSKTYSCNAYKNISEGFEQENEIVTVYKVAPVQKNATSRLKELNRKTKITTTKDTASGGVDIDNQTLVTTWRSDLTKSNLVTFVINDKYYKGHTFSGLIRYMYTKEIELNVKELFQNTNKYEGTYSITTYTQASHTGPITKKTKIYVAKLDAFHGLRLYDDKGNLILAFAGDYSNLSIDTKDGSFTGSINDNTFDGKFKINSSKTVYGAMCSVGNVFIK